MYENFISKVDYKYGMDTNSLFFRARDINKIDRKLFGDKLGQVKVELPCNTKRIYVAKKIYANYIINNNVESIIKFRFKRLCSNDKFICSTIITQVERLHKGGDNVSLSNMWDSLPSACNIDMLRSMLNNDKVYILSSQISRKLKGNTSTRPFNLRGRFVIKTYNKHYTV